MQTAASPKTIATADYIEGAAKALAILESFSAVRQRLNTTQAAERAGMTRAAARRHLLTLQALGYLESRDGVFWLAPKVLRFAGNYLSSARLPRAVQPTLNRLSFETGKACSVAVLDEGDVVIVARSGEHRSFSATLPHGVHLGARLPAYATSTGRVLLSQLSRAEQADYFASTRRAPLTPNTELTQTGLRKILKTAAADGYCEARQEHELGVWALAVPLQDMQGKCLAALNIVEMRHEPISLTTRYLGVLRQASAEIRSLL